MKSDCRCPRLDWSNEALLFWSFRAALKSEVASTSSPPPDDINVHPRQQPYLIDIPKYHLNMAFSMRQPLRLTTILAGSSKTAFRSPAIRTFHSKPATNFFTSRTSTPVNALTKGRNAFRQSRNYQQPAAAVLSGGNLMQKLVLGGALFGGTCKKPIFLPHTPSPLVYSSRG